MRRTLGTSASGLLAAVFVLVFGLGCGSITEKIKQSAANASNASTANTNSTYDPTRFDPKIPGPGERLFDDKAQLDAFVAALTAAVGNDNPSVLKMSFYDRYAMVEVQDPAKPENIDGYQWRDGKLSPPSPVKIIGSGKIADNVFPLKDVNFAGLPDLTKEVEDKVKDVEGGKMIGYVIRRGLPFNKDIEISPLTNASRKSITAEADKNAKLKKFEVK